MKIKTCLLGFLSLFIMLVSFQQPLHAKKDCAKIIKKLPYTISDPGVYKLSCDFVFSPAVASAAITIDADNVLLNLKNHTLSQGNTLANVVGIEIAPAHQNITIRNGKLEFFTQAAIYSFIPDAVPQISSKTLLFKNLTITNNGVDGQSRPETADGTGIALQDPGSASSPGVRADYKYYDVTIDNCNVNFNIGVAIMAAQINGLVIKNSHADNTYINNPTFTNVLGMTMKNCENVRLLNSTFNNSTLFSGGGNRVGGIRSSDNYFVEIDGCQFNGHTALSSAGFVLGITGGMDNNWLVQNSQFCNMFGGPGTGVVNGFHNSHIGGQTIIGGGFKIINCQFNNLSAAPGTAIQGIYFDVTKDAYVEDCQFYDYSIVPAATPTDFVAGFLLNFDNSDPVNDAIASVTSVTLKNCVMSRFVAGYVGGCSFIMPNSLPKPPGVPIYANITLEDNTIASLSGSGLTFGIQLENDAVAATSPTFIFKNAAINNNNIMDIRGAAGSAGILVNNVNNPVLTNNIVEDSDTGILFTGSAATGFVNKGLVENNKVTNCTTGYQDTLSLTNSAWINNVASLNGTNYSITWAGLPTTWPLDIAPIVGPFPSPGNKYNNLSLN